MLLITLLIFDRYSSSVSFFYNRTKAQISTSTFHMILLVFLLLAQYVLNAQLIHNHYIKILEI